MPNWCINDLVVSHDDPNKMDELRKVVEKSVKNDSGADSICSHFYPEPNYEEEEVEDAFPQLGKPSIMPDWWNWRVVNWGTKWEESDLEVLEDEGNTMHLSFMTAWSPPRGIVQKMVEQGFSTEFWYMEQGNDFWGYELDGEEIHGGCPSDFLLDGEPSKEKGLKLGISEEIWNKCALGEIRGG